MLARYDKYYVPALYVTVGILLARNALTLASGEWLALLPIGIQATVVWTVFQRKPWAHLIVRIWAAICIVAGASLWLAVLLRGGEIVEPMGRVEFSTFLLIVGLFFMRRAKTVLSPQISGFEAAQQGEG
ncbi:hypothetical protein [Dyella sp. Tek66A03]|uniref:hypothetical protein n=1 Tax=Dyella sp. Tek66A03 TaxID=3458298 RepID=UPI00403E6CDC